MLYMTSRGNQVPDTYSGAFMFISYMLYMTSRGNQVPDAYSGPICIYIIFISDSCKRSGTGAGFLRVLRFPLLIIIPPLLRSHLSPPHEVRDGPGQAPQA
jgi:hypothetical protein